MESIKDNTVMLVENGNQKEVKLPSYGEITIKTQDGKIIGVEFLDKVKFENL